MTERVVQKFGGSVLTDMEAYRRAARHVAQTAAEGYRVVVVVSARGGVTDTLLDRARFVQDRPDPEALDLLLASGELESASLLAMALRERGLCAEAVNPWQLGLHTDSSHGDARITRINPLPLKARLAERPVVIVPGFIGRGHDGCLTTLGRGGSDLSAVALSDALDAEACEFFKDVPGYFSADPDHVADAVHRPRVTAAEAVELSRFGCRFLQDRAIDWAVRTRCRVRLRALDEDRRATVLEDAPGPDHPRILALTHCPARKAVGAGSGVRPGGDERSPGGVLADNGRVVDETTDGGNSACMISLVGWNLGRDGSVVGEASEKLTRRGITHRFLEACAHRVTVVVPETRLAEAQLALHGLVRV